MEPTSVVEFGIATALLVVVTLVATLLRAPSGAHAARGGAPRLVALSDPSLNDPRTAGRSAAWQADYSA
ncbi:MAG TPA: hypothetical protein VGQ52_19695 [Gemmatimonadaceae bacterium]|nr:hypothetical protein [Gemmatimonadaceae bacterium]